jgi:hypothetical protein
MWPGGSDHAVILILKQVFPRNTEALKEVQKAKELWLQAARAERKPIPAPKYRPVIYQAASA